jgi:hypothetical protein
VHPEADVAPDVLVEPAVPGGVMAPEVPHEEPPVEVEGDVVAHGVREEHGGPAVAGHRKLDPGAHGAEKAVALFEPPRRHPPVIRQRLEARRAVPESVHVQWSDEEVIERRIMERL